MHWFLLEGLELRLKYELLKDREGEGYQKESADEYSWMKLAQRSFYMIALLTISNRIISSDNYHLYQSYINIFMNTGPYLSTHEGLVLLI